MPKITEETPLKDLQIAGMLFKVPAPYSEGHVLSQLEADALNGLLGENLRNNFAAQIKKKNEVAEAAKTEKPSLAALQDELTTYAAEYEFGARRSSTGTVGTSADPVDRELDKMARDMTKDRLRAKGYKLKDVTPELLAGFVEKLIESRPDLREEAVRRVEAQKALAALGDVELGDLPPKVSATETPATETPAVEVPAEPEAKIDTGSDEGVAQAE